MLNLPDLPKKNKKIEANFGTFTFKKWVEDNADILEDSSFELKQTTNDYISFEAVEPRQIDHAQQIRWSNKGCLIRVIEGNPGAPDYIFLKKSPAFIVIKYPKGFVIIDIDTFLLEKERSKRKSLTWEKAQEIAWKVIHR